MAWTTEQVIALAPDASSAKAGKGLATARKWKTLGLDDHAAWGLCQGSGKNPYQTCIELAEPAFKCSCPSRKFPCKHGLGLLLLVAEQPGGFKETKHPPWLDEWLASRKERAEKKAEKAAKKHADAEAAAADPEKHAKLEAQQAKRAAKREERVAAGVADLELWLRDLIRQGLAAAQTQAYSFWEQPAARLMDAQASGLRRMVLEMSSIPSSGAGWQERLLERAGRLYLLTQSLPRLEQLPPETQADIRTTIGWNVEKEQVLAGAGERDRWAVLGQYTFTDELDENLRIQRTWLWGEKTKKPALLLQFAFQRQPFEAALVPGTILDGELAFFPGALPLRALIKTRHGDPLALEELPGSANVREAYEAYGKALATMPWLAEFPFALKNVTPELQDEQFVLRDADNCALPIAPSYKRSWELLALSGGRPLDVAGEWDGHGFVPLNVRTAGRWVLVPPRRGEDER
jgi:hypothetical protein